jgi:hypothetical protein
MWGLGCRAAGLGEDGGMTVVGVGLRAEAMCEAGPLGN